MIMIKIYTTVFWKSNGKFSCENVDFYILNRLENFSIVKESMIRDEMGNLLTGYKRIWWVSKAEDPIFLYSQYSASDSSIIFVVISAK